MCCGDWVCGMKKPRWIAGLEVRVEEVCVVWWLSEGSEEEWAARVCR